jgi:thiol-disulfide isomerase/thioredoxin
MKVRQSLFGLLLLLTCFGSFNAYSQQVAIVSIDKVKQLINNQSDTIHVVNFWATWCAPCVKELPDFMRLSETYQHKNVRVWLISMDFPSSVETKLKPFLRNRNIQQPVWLLNNTDYDSWIPVVDGNWQGDIPFTLIFNNQRNKRVVISGETNYRQLEQYLEEMF